MSIAEAQTGCLNQMRDSQLRIEAYIVKRQGEQDHELQELFTDSDDSHQ